MTKLDYETLLIDIDEGVATVTLNRPEQLNAFDRVMSEELDAAIIDLDRADEVRVIVVTGAGRAFCAGVDVGGSMPVGSDGPAPPRTNFDPPSLKAWELQTPIIAAINGAAVGKGLSYPLMWDIRIAAKDAKMGLVFTRRGLVPEGNSAWTLQRLVGASKATELLLTGRYFTGEEAAEMGLVSQAVERDEVLPTALAIAHDIARNTSPGAVAMTKHLIYRFMQMDDRWVARREELDMFRWALEQPDSREGVKAFLEKRAPDWTPLSEVNYPSDFDLPEGWN